MTAAEEKLRAGDLAGCLQELQAEIRRKPAESKPRIFLAQLLMVLGEWDRAITQLTVVGEMDASAIPMTRAYGSAIQCERLRASIFKGERSPLIFGDPEPWIALVVQALAAVAAGRTAQADEIRAQAYETAPAIAGTLNGTDFEWIADADSRLGPVLEVLLNGAYYWVPFQRIAAIRFETPSDLRDLVWLPAQFTWANGGEAMGFIPTRYAGSESDADSGVRLARKTEWTPIGSDAFAGRGQRVLATSADEVPLLEVRELLLRLPGS
ncbi:MAG TPA: type VI secretion system accessory protein TagJ [Steroidobacteraceae bacterium]|nr:type VI secretion system accessory protein TagJ [Steroidobacteraceae bacterium]